MASTFLDRYLPKDDRKIGLEEFCNVRKEIFQFFCAKFTHSRLACQIKIWPKTVLLLELERLYESCKYSMVAKLPAGPPDDHWWSPRQCVFQAFFKFFKFWCHEKNLSLSTDFSKTHRQTWRVHFWIGIDLKMIGKLVWNNSVMWEKRFFNFSARNLYILA